MDAISFDQIHHFHQSNPDLDLLNSYFMGICTHLFPNINSLDIFEKTLPLNLSLLYKSFALERKETNFLAQFLTKISSSVHGSISKVPDLTETFEERIEHWFKDFGAMKILFPSITNVQWFYVGNFMATQTSTDLLAIMKTIYIDFIFETRDVSEEERKVRVLRSALAAKFEALGLLNDDKSDESSTKSESNEADKFVENIPSDKSLVEKQETLQVFRRNSQQNIVSKDEQDENALYERARDAVSRAKFELQLIKERGAARRPLRALSLEQNRMIEEPEVSPKGLHKSNSSIESPKKTAQITEEPPLDDLIKKLFSRKKKNLAECPICFEKATISTLTPLLICQHSFHLECLQEFLKMRIDGRSFPMICPMDKCGSQIFGSEIETLLDEDYKAKYHTYSLDHFIDSHPKEYFRCPGVDCKYWASRGETMSFYCSTCAKAFCMECCGEWHDGMTCKEYEISQKVDENDTMFKEYLTDNSCEKCPFCRYFVHKVDGCNHIKCQCGQEFCYVCGEEWGTCSCDRDNDY